MYTELPVLDTFLQKLKNFEDKSTYFEILHLRASISQAYDAAAQTF